MNRYRLLFSMILLLFLSPCLRAGEWQWSVTLDGFVSNETNRNPTAFLWIPADCMQIKAIIVGQHNMSEETLFDNPLFREKMQKLGIGFVWITPGIDQQWDVSKGTQQIFEKMMVSLADVSGYSELKNVHRSHRPFGYGYLSLEFCRMESGTYLGYHFLAWRCSAHKPYRLRA